MNKQFVGIIIVVLVALFGVFTLTSNKKDAENGTTNSTSSVSNHVRNPDSTAKVTLLEYGDFQCPACKSYYPFVKELESTYGDKVKFQFRHFPLVQIHPNAFLGARAAEAAGQQGKFFEMHDLLYENQDSWAQSQSPNTFFEAFAKQLNLNVDQFKADMASAAVGDVINADAKAAKALGSTSTPTFVINDKRIEKNPQTVDEFKKLIDDALAANQ